MSSGSKCLAYDQLLQDNERGIHTTLPVGESIDDPHYWGFLFLDVTFLSRDVSCLLSAALGSRHHCLIKEPRGCSHEGCVWAQPGGALKHMSFDYMKA